jgi:uncharacterized pyridoxal phosphate-containing UPF0001 family protein
VDVADAKTLAQRAASLEGIHVAGLMAIPPKPETPDASRPFFSRLRDLRDEIATVAPSVADLSMGMSADLGVAVEEGATIVRVGEAIFGPR